MFLDLRLPRTTFVAGAVIQSEVQVRNTTSDDVMVEPTVWAVPDGHDATNALLQADARAFPTFSRGPAFHGAQVPSGQTWAIPSVAQLPFEAAPPAHLQASVGLVTPVAPGRFEAGVRVIVDLALHLMAATAAQELHLELHADHRQWCLRATDARGAPRLAPSWSA